MVMLGDVGQICDDGCDDSAEGIPLVRIGQMVVEGERGGTESVNYVSPSRLLRMSVKWEVRPVCFTPNSQAHCQSWRPHSRCLCLFCKLCDIKAEV